MASLRKLGVWPMTPASPTTVLEVAKWKAALFTTYALSLSFFESVVLHRLRGSGCREIWVVVDADGYRKTLMEGRSCGVGHQYRLIPVALPNGIFHPKCIYLAGEDTDVLMVGSGNLTFGGWGRNLEVLEVARSDHEPALFAQFGDFLDRLARRSDLMVPDRTWLERFRYRAQHSGMASRPESSPQGPWLLTSTERSVMDQLIEHTKAHGQARHLTILSPYHDPHGGVVRRLAEGTGAARVSIGLPLDGEETTFPFSEAQTWPLAVEAVRPVVAEGERHLHAKWIQISLGDRDLILTGSVNATSKSLGGTDNIEVSVLRERSRTEQAMKWDPAPVPVQQQSQIFFAAGMGDACLIHAWIESGCIRGQVFSQSLSPGFWAGHLHRPTGEMAEIRVQVAESGHFTSEAPVPEPFWTSTSVQIELSGPDCSARGWLQNDDILRAQVTRAVDVALLVRLINREETEDDQVALLDFLARSLARLPPPPPGKAAPDAISAKVTPAGHGFAGEEERLIPLSLLRPFAQPVEAGGEMRLTSAAQTPLQRLFSHLRQVILGGFSNQDGAGSSGSRLAAGNDVDDAAAAEERTTINARVPVRQSIESFDEELHKLADQGEPGYRRALLVLWLEVSLHMRLSRLGERGPALQFLRRWFVLATEIVRSEEPWGALEDHVVMASALLAWEPAQPGCESLLSAVYLHERLDRFFGIFGKVPDRAWVAVESGTGAALANRCGADALARRTAFAAILATRTRRQELFERLQDYVDHRSPVATSSLFEGPLGARLRAALSAWDRQRVFPLGADLSGCPGCFCDLSALRATLHRERLLACPYCDRLIVDLTP